METRSLSLCLLIFLYARENHIAPKLCQNAQRISGEGEYIYRDTIYQRVFTLVLSSLNQYGSTNGLKNWINDMIQYLPSEDIGLLSYAQTSNSTLWLMVYAMDSVLRAPIILLGTMTHRTKITNSAESLHNALELINVLTLGRHHRPPSL